MPPSEAFSFVYQCDRCGAVEVGPSVVNEQEWALRADEYAPHGVRSGLSRTRRFALDVEAVPPVAVDVPEARGREVLQALILARPN